MKFGKFIQSQQAEWGGAYYLNYKALKKIINSIEKDRVAKGETHKPVSSSVSIEHPSHELYSYKTAFFFKLERELEKINTFYLQKEKDFKIRLSCLLDKKRILLSSHSKRVATSLINLKEAVTQFRTDLTKLQNYVEVNATGFRKILKKWDKRSKSSTKEIYLSRQVEIQPCFNRDVLTELTDAATICLVEMDQLLEETDQVVVQGQQEDEWVELEHVLVNALLTGQSDASKLVQDMLHKVSSTSLPDPDIVSRIFLRTCTDGPLDLLTLLLESGHVNVCFSDDISDRTSVHHVAMAGRSDVLSLILNHSTFTFGHTDVYGRHPLHYIGMYGHTECLDVLLKHKVGPWDTVDHDHCTPLIYAITHHHIACATLLIEQGACIEAKSPHSPIPLCLASQYGQLSIAHLLLQKGAHVNTPNADGVYPLHLTSRYGHALLTRLLLDHGALIECKDTFHIWTPLFFSASEGHLENTRVLLAAGAQCHVFDEYHWLPWTYALYKGHVAVAECVAVKDLDVSHCMDASVLSPSLPYGSPHYETSITTTQSEPIVAHGASTVFSVASAVKPMAPSAMFATTSTKPLVSEKESDVALDDIPSLSLPPPIIPFRIYGHNYLDNKWFIQIKFEKATTPLTHPETKPIAACSTPFFTQPLRKRTVFEDASDSAISMFGNQQLSTFKLLISSKPEVGIPYSVILPIEDETDVFTFLVDEGDIKSFMLQFDIYPTFGTKVIGRAVASPDMLGIRSLLHSRDVVDSRKNTCPLLDSNLRVVGEIGFQCHLVKPFKHACLSIGGAVQTYWKSTLTKIVDHQSTALVATHALTSSTHTSVQRFITASSLLEEYVYVLVHVTQDNVPIIYNKWYIEMNQAAKMPIKAAVSSLTLDQVQLLVEKSARIKATLQQMVETSESLDMSKISCLLEGSALSLLDVLKMLPSSVGLCIQVCYPDKDDLVSHSGVFVQPCHTTYINKVVDAVLTAVYDSSQSRDSSKTPSRSIIFSSRHPNICTALNWKQPNYGVFFKTHAGFPRSDSRTGGVSDPRCGSIKSAIKFAKSNNLLGLICRADPLIQMPILISTIKESGLILASFGDANTEIKFIKTQQQFGVDALVFDGLFRYTTVT